MSRFPSLLLLLALPLPTRAAEVTWDGFYRARLDAFDSLSLSRTNEQAEGGSMTLDHRLRLQPTWLIGDRVSVGTQVDLLPFVNWGDEPVEQADPATGEALPRIFDDAVQPPTTSEGGATLGNLRVTRLWGQLETDWGRVRVGRVPVHWGSGMVFNSGDAPDSEYGDTADRVMVAGRASDVYLMAAYEVRYEGYVGQPDDYRAVVGSVAYEAEQAGIGFYNTYRWANYDDAKVGLWIADVAGHADAGPLHLEGEFAAVIGQGDLSTGANDVNISAFGATLDSSVRMDRLVLGLGLGLAGGDSDPTDSKIHTFTFDPDYNVGILMFEEPMPVLEASVLNSTNGGRETGAVLTGDGVSNAVYARPSAGWSFEEGLEVELSALLAQQARVPVTQDAARKGYGAEIDLGVRYEPAEHFELSATGALFLPGGYYSGYEDADLGGGFSDPAWGGRALGTFRF